MKDNAGFTLVEVLVCIAILGIVFSVIMQSFITGGNLNRKAHLNQQATALAQETAELFQTNSIEYLSQAGVFAVPKEDVVVWPSGITEEQKKQYPEELFRKCTFEKPGMPAADGTLYDVEVILDASPYSVVDGAGRNAESANSRETGLFQHMDPMKNAVIIGQLNTYDDSIAATMLDQMTEAQAAALGLDSRPDRAAKVDALKTLFRTSPDFVKEMDISLTTDGGIEDGEIVVCAMVTYRFRVNGNELTETYTVYRSSFPLQFKEGQWKSGGNLYISAIPMTRDNDRITVHTNYLPAAQEERINLFLVRGVDKDKIAANLFTAIYNFGRVDIAGAAASSCFMNRGKDGSAVVSAPENGKIILGEINIISNMQGTQTDSAVDAAGNLKDAFLSRDSSRRSRMMQITVRVYEPGSLAFSDIAEREKRIYAEWNAAKQVP